MLFYSNVLKSNLMNLYFITVSYDNLQNLTYNSGLSYVCLTAVSLVRNNYRKALKQDDNTQKFLLLEKVPQDLFLSVYFEYEENCTHDRLLSLNYAFCHIKRSIKTSEPVYVD